MKHILPILFLLTTCIIFPKNVFAAISFTISDPVKKDDYYEVDVTLSGISSDTAYVQGMFTSTSTPSYFGYTWGQKDDWVKYQSTNKEFITSLLPKVNKEVTRKIWIRPDYESKSYKGPGEYFLKLKRYTGGSDGPTGEEAVKTIILDYPLVTDTPTETPTPTPTITTTSTPTITSTPTTQSTPTARPTSTNTPTIRVTVTSTPKSTPTSQKISPLTSPSVEIIEIPTGTPSSQPYVLGDSTVSAATVTVPQKFTVTKPKTVNYRNLFLIGVMVTLISGGALYFRHRKD